MLSAAVPAWHLHISTWGLFAVLAGAYWLALRRERQRRGPGGQAPATRFQMVAFGGGVAVMWVASDYPLHDLAENYLYSAHMVQHLLFTLVASLLLLVGTPDWLARRLLRPRWLLGAVRGMSRPVQNLVQFNAVLVLSHWPVVVEGTLRFHGLHFVAHTVLVLSAVLMWMPVASPLPEVRRLAPPAQMMYLFLQTILPTVPASFLTFGTSPLYPLYATFPRMWGISPILDQQIAGLVMKIAGGLYLWVVIAVVFFQWHQREEGRPAGRGPSTGPAPPADGVIWDDVLLWDDVEKELRRLEGTTAPPEPPRAQG